VHVHRKLGRAPGVRGEVIKPHAAGYLAQSLVVAPAVLSMLAALGSRC
jgi:hypothetical protein